MGNFYTAYIRSDQWRAKRQEAFAWHGRKCSGCGGVKMLQVHHLHYRTLGRENVEVDLAVLCKPCHRSEHGLGPVDRGKKQKKRKPKGERYKTWKSLYDPANIYDRKRMKRLGLLPSPPPLVESPRDWLVRCGMMLPSVP